MNDLAGPVAPVAALHHRLLQLRSLGGVNHLTLYRGAGGVRRAAGADAASRRPPD